MKFSELNLPPKILDGLKQMGFTELTPVQEQTFPHILAGRDLMARAETGSGKTSACGIPMVLNTDPEIKAVQGLIIVPTRELALQYVQEIADIARQTAIKPFAVYGGLNTQIQKAKLTDGVHILVATPGRLIDLLYNSPLSLSEVRTFVLDEADEMLKMGFIDDIEFIISCLVHEHQTLMFSATMPAPIRKLAKKHLRDPVMIELNKEQVAPQNLQHQFQQISPRNRYETLVQYIKQNDPKQAIIFCNSRLNVVKVFEKLRQEFSSVECIHGGLEQSKRTSLFNRFRQQKIRFMVATNVASRGLDFQHASHVINYDFPASVEAYTHRTGRTARMGRSGVALTLFSNRDTGILREIIKSNHIEPVWLGEKPNLSRAPSRRGGGRTRSNSGGRSSHNRKNRNRSSSSHRSNKD